MAKFVVAGGSCGGGNKTQNFCNFKIIRWSFQTSDKKHDILQL